jgi:hypothetical protein
MGGLGEQTREWVVEAAAQGAVDEQVGSHAA